jgi:exopolyphosphatase/guanosine-5'-triphosphate,3'-diphosphate pyrophosphatase
MAPAKAAHPDRTDLPQTPDPSAPIAAAIDIGSNSIKMTVARLDSQGFLESLDWAAEAVRLGHDLGRTGRLAEERIDAAIAALRRFAARAIELGATRIVAVATEATRAAANGGAFLAQVRDETGIEVRIIDGHEEAALIFQGVAASTDMSAAALIADIGGGSTELVVSRDGVMGASTSIPLGSGRLTDRLVPSDPPSPVELAAVRAEAGDTVCRALETMLDSQQRPTRLILVGGTGEFLARLVGLDRAIDSDTISAVLERLATATASQVAAELAIPEARARVLPAGVAIVAAIVEWLGPTSIEVSHSGLRAGLLVGVLRRGS